MNKPVNQLASKRATRRGFLWIARVGYGGRGLVFLLLGIFASLSVFGVGWKPLGATEMFLALPNFPAGWILLALLGLGVLCFALYRASDAIFDMHNYGSDLKGMLRRLSLGLSGICYAVFAFIAASIILGWQVSGSSDRSVRDWTSWLMSFPAGEWLVGIVGGIVIATGIGMGIASIKGSFNHRVRFHREEKSAAVVLGRFGALARSLIMLLIGGFLVFAAARHNPQYAEGFSGALRVLQQQRYGSVLLGMTAVGMLCFGLFGIAEAFRAKL